MQLPGASKLLAGSRLVIPDKGRSGRFLVSRIAALGIAALVAIPSLEFHLR